jgi:hypothetical protein
MSRKDTNWEEKLEEGETFTKEGKKIVKLVGLQRLAWNEAGLVKSSCEISHIPGKNLGIVQCVYTAEFDDGTIWVGTGDCNELNTSSEFIAYPTAIAESRAESRCLKKALGIFLLTAEEIGFRNIDSLETSPNTPIGEGVVKTIQKLCTDKDVDQVEVLENVVEDRDRAATIFELSQLTNEEGRRALEFLNSKTMSKRSARKAELKSKQG